MMKTYTTLSYKFYQIVIQRMKFRKTLFAFAILSFFLLKSCKKDKKIILYKHENITHAIIYSVQESQIKKLPKLSLYDKKIYSLHANPIKKLKEKIMSEIVNVKNLYIELEHTGIYRIPNNNNKFFFVYSFSFKDKNRRRKGVTTEEALLVQTSRVFVKLSDLSDVEITKISK